MRKYFFPILIVFLMATTVESFGTNYYVRKGATGTNKGTDWTNAWNEMNQINFSTVACGDTIWLAGGTYTTGLTVNKSCNSGALLSINRVLSSDSVPAAALGWSSAYDSQVVINGANIDLAAGSYINIDGRIGTVSGNNFGISIQCLSGNGCDGIDGAGSGNLSNINLYHLELYGPPCVTAGSCTLGADGLNVAPSNNTVTNLLFDHGWIHRYSETIRTSNWTGCTVQYSDIDTMAQTTDEHEDIIFSYPIKNFTFRYNTVWGSPNDGIFFYGNEINTEIYGNVFYHSGGALITFYEGFTHNVFIYNNVFENDGTFGDYQPAWLTFAGTMTGEIANNVWENVNKNGSCPICSYNAYSLSGNASGETGSFTYTKGTQFVSESSGNPLAANFHLTAAGVTAFANKGKALSVPYNMDADGNIRGADGGWDVGAYEYHTSQAPGAPTGLVGVPR